MSADDFKAQASNQSIGATSIPSEEAFGTVTLAHNSRVTVSSGIVSTAGISTNSSLFFVNSLLLNSGIASSEIFLNNNSFGLNSTFSVPSITKLLRDSELILPTVYSSIGITLNSIQSGEGFTSPTIAGVSYISFSGNGISSLEALGTHSFGSNTYINVDTSINSAEFLSDSNVIYSINNIYPSAIDSSETLENTNIFGNITGIFLTTGIISSFSSPENTQFTLLGALTNILLSTGISSKETFGRRIILGPPPPSVIKKGLIYGYTTVVNNILVTIEQKNILDNITKIPEKIISNQARPEAIYSYIDSKFDISSSIDVVYDIEAEIIEETALTARQTEYYLESYIKQKYKISSNIYVDENDIFYSTRSGKIN